MCFEKPYSPLSLIFLPNSVMGGNHGKMTLLLRRIRRDQTKNNSRGRNCDSHDSNLGFLDIIVLRGRYAILNSYLKMRRRIWRNKYNLYPKNRGLKQQKKSSHILRKEKL